MTANLENLAVAKGLVKVKFHSNPKERQCQRMLKLPHNALISHDSKARFQQYQEWTKNFQIFNLDLEKSEKPEIKLPTYVGS